MKQKKDKSLGEFTILKENKVEYVKMDIDMTETFRNFLIKEGKKAAKENEDFYVNLGFNALIRKYVDQKGTKSNKNNENR